MFQQLDLNDPCQVEVLPLFRIRAAVPAREHGLGDDLMARNDVTETWVSVGGECMMRLSPRTMVLRVVDSIDVKVGTVPSEAYRQTFMREGGVVVGEACSCVAQCYELMVLRLEGTVHDRCGSDDVRLGFVRIEHGVVPNLRGDHV